MPKPFRCYAITVAGLNDDECGAPVAGYTPHSQAQSSRSIGVNLGFLTERC
jgi:hypothetical protein